MVVKSKFNPADILEEVKNNSSEIASLELIDETGFEKAPNLLAWATAPQFMNTRILPRQIEIGAKLLAEYCPQCSTKGYIDTLLGQSIGQIKSNIVFLEYGKCPVCKTTRYEFVEAGLLNSYNEFIGVMGQRSGKTKLAGLVISYLTHRMLMLPNPLKKFNLPSGEIISGTFAALTQDQAMTTIWASVKGFIDEAPWFKSYHAFLKKKSKEMKVVLFKDNATKLEYNHKHILLQCTGSEDRKMRGKTRFLAGIDELGWFVVDEVQKSRQIMSADGVYTALSNSLATMRMKHGQLWSPTEYDLPPPMMINISSPSAAKDKSMRLYKKSLTNKKMLGMHLTSWHANPDYTEDSLREEYQSMDELDFLRDFAAEPPLASNPFISEYSAIDRIATGILYDRIVHQIALENDPMGSAYKSAYAHINGADKMIPRMITLDLGTTKNALAVCVFSLTRDQKPHLDFVLNLKPEKNRRINMAHVFDHFTVKLVQMLNIKHAFFDRWQSMDQVARLRELKVDAQIHSLTYKEMDNIKSLILAQGVVIPKLEHNMTHYVEKYKESDVIDLPSIAELGIQLLTVRDLGHRMVKPLVGDDDIFRAFCLGVLKLSDPAIKKQYIFENTSNSGFAPTERALGRVFNRGGALNSGSGMVYNSNIGSVKTKKGR